LDQSNQSLAVVDKKTLKVFPVVVPGVQREHALLEAAERRGLVDPVEPPVAVSIVHQNCT
jgi:hypothetical protein